MFNQDIHALVEGEESVGSDDSRLFTKVRMEFGKWSIEIEKSFQRGECGAPPSTQHLASLNALTPNTATSRGVSGWGFGVLIGGRGFGLYHHTMGCDSAVARRGVLTRAAARLEREGSCSVKEGRRRKPPALGCLSREMSP